ncbi:hypothetical protein CTI12_AA228790 [Artemisia annua]|uniref:Uncharacterized protein n=1 Tax=Artemisia annua TaxID=35608 RepID=A0A2U1NR36_ARTAN|nr:hypothetical protein CTI12_AA228790 [Artemisia annua]
MSLKNVLIAFIAPLPSIFFYIYFLNHHQDNNHLLSFLWNWCDKHPLILANILFFLNIDVGFWLISLLQCSNWMIDLYWTVIPVMLVHYFGSHPAAEYNSWRSMVVVVLTWVWAIRLTHNYLRREKWQCGAREDWRFTDMAKQHGPNWWWVSFFGVYLIQQVFLFGVCLPLYIVHSVNKPLNIWDVIALVICISGIVYAYIADTQLHAFVSNTRTEREGQAMVLILMKACGTILRHQILWVSNYGGGTCVLWLELRRHLGFCWRHHKHLVFGYVDYTCGEKRMLKQEYLGLSLQMYQKHKSV